MQTAAPPIPSPLRALPAALAALSAVTLLSSACGRLHDRVEDLVRGWNSCQPVDERCLANPGDFYAIPQMAALETWRGRGLAELLAAWGQPETVEAVGGGLYRYVWREAKTIPGGVSYQHDQWSGEWDLVRTPDQVYECRTYMGVDEARVVTPMWVDRLGVCTEYFGPRVPAPPAAAPAPTPASPAGRRAGGASPAAAPAAEDPSDWPPLSLEPPRQIREREGL
ncbi:MAG: hypothetical protein LBG06_02685 [Deltaproteobacteria bacterium]|jgi:hypothetical protein|nr:hypothetical protein [Deltaproteobacteria bacterium]